MSASHPESVPLIVQIHEVQDELARRKNSYRWMIRRGDWTQAKADHHIKVMMAVLKTLEGLRDA